MTNQEQESDISEKDDPIHLNDLQNVLLEENWLIDDRDMTSQNGMAFRKYGTDYDKIVIQNIHNKSDKISFMVTIPLPSKTGSYRTRIDTTLDVFLYITAFIEYYAEITLPQINNRT